MADNDHILSTESTPLNTTLEPNATDATTEVNSASTDHSSNPSSEAVHTTDAAQNDVVQHDAVQHSAPAAETEHVASISASASDDAEPEYDAEDFAKRSKALTANRPQRKMLRSP